MAQAAPIESEYERTARNLAAAHRAADPDTRFIFLDREHHTTVARGPTTVA